MTLAVKNGWPRRMWMFMEERHPLANRLVLSSLVYLAPAAFSAHLHGNGPALWSISTLAGIVTVFSFYLILRLSDELKDIALDSRLFPERPLPSGRVTPWDLQSGLIFLFLLTPVLNLGTGIAFLAASGVLVYEFLMYRFFFIPNILRRRPLLNLLAHNPIFALIPLYSILTHASHSHAAVTTLAWGEIVLFIVMMWMPFLGWEIGRKLRIPAAEDPYDIYSPALSHSGAVSCVIAAQTITFSISLFLASKWSLGWVYIATITIPYALAVTANLRFLTAPSESSARLKPFTEIFAGSVLAAQLIGFGKEML